MGLPRKLKNCNAFANGMNYLGVVAEFEEPKLEIDTDEWRGGGMPGAVMVDKGLKAMEATLTMGGHVAELIRNFGTSNVAGVRLRLVSAFQADDGSAPQAVECFIGGRFSQIDVGKAKPGDSTEHKYTVPLAYYRRVVDGRLEVEIDMVAGIFIVGGIDRYAEIMSIISS